MSLSEETKGRKHMKRGTRERLERLPVQESGQGGQNSGAEAGGLALSPTVKRKEN